MTAQPEQPPVPTIDAATTAWLLPRLQAHLPSVPAEKVAQALRRAVDPATPALRAVRKTASVSPQPTLEQVLHRTALWWTLHMGVSVSAEALRAEGRTPSIAQARNLAYWMMRHCTERSSTEIGRFLGRDHTSVLNGEKSAMRWAEERCLDLGAVAAEWIDQEPR